MAEHKVKISGVIEIPVEVLVTEDEYEAWEAKDSAALEQVGSRLGSAAQEALEGADAAYLQLKTATLVEDDGYLGTDIAVLKRL